MSCRCPRERPLNETHRKCRQERLNRAKSVSFSHLTKHRLIKRLQCFLPETQLKPCPHYGALPPKISLIASSWLCKAKRDGSLSEIGLRTPGVNPGVKARSRRLQVFVRR